VGDLVVGFGLVDRGIPGEESRVFHSLADLNVVPTLDQQAISEDGYAKVKSTGAV